ncbi:hypothetical protein F4818DRAFT_280304 [Hypoxylon cercidicola]|nr:hypothetical protein F4818DRAFT_280304 [Hypoxylon cercidicola]
MTLRNDYLGHRLETREGMIKTESSATSLERFTDDADDDGRAAFTLRQKGSTLSSMTTEQNRWNHTAKTEQPYICPDCGKALCNPNTLHRHLKTRHGMGKQWYCKQPDCKRRSKPYGRLDHFKYHMKGAHNIVVSSHDARKHFLLDDGSRNPRSKSPDHSGRHVIEFQAFGRQPLPDPNTNERTCNRDSTAIQPIRHDVLPQDEARPRITEGDFEPASREELILMLQSQTLECKRLHEQCKFLTLERDEYAEALQLSEEMRRDGR